MNFRSAIAAGIIGVIAVSIALAVFTSEQDDKDKIRLAFFPNVGHAVPIIGLEQDIFYEKLGSEITVEKKIFDSGPQVIESLFARAIDVAYVGPGPAINGFLKSENHNIVILAGIKTSVMSLLPLAPMFCAASM